MIDPVLLQKLPEIELLPEIDLLKLGQCNINQSIP